MSRSYYALLTTAILLSSSAALAADELKFGAAPTWVVPQVIPTKFKEATDAPIAFLLQDQQLAFEPGKTTSYTEGAIRIQNPQGLAAGNIAFAWQPATDTVTVNKLRIRRGNEIIDVLASGQTFTTLRRETNLDAAVLDGTLTASIQPEGLREGDIIEFATTTEHSDPILKGHIETSFATWNGLPIGLGHARLTWPDTMKVKTRVSGGLAALPPTIRNGKSSIELVQREIEPLVLPKGAPARFGVGRMAEATDFSSWADVAELMIPLYRSAAVIPASGSLHDEVEKIRKSSNNSKDRADQALRLVQERVRYVALLMGQGGYVPASAESTWSRRFGDCKAKTALLLAILHALDIEAEPVAVNTGLGDAVADRLPMVGVFNHVLVRARISGKTYWLDGTRSGDATLDKIPMPDFGWGLPLSSNSNLVAMVPPPLTVPNSEQFISIDATAGIYTPAQVTVEEVYRGDGAIELNTLYSQATSTQRDQALRELAKRYFDSISVKTSSVQFDKVNKEMRLTAKGEAKLEWKDDWFSVPASSLAYTPDFERQPGPAHDAPLAVGYPNFSRKQVTIQLPPGFLRQQQIKLPPIAKERLAGVEYARAITANGDTLSLETTERALVPEIAYKEAVAAEARLRAIDDDDVYLRVPNDYRPSSTDVLATSSDKPASARAFLKRGLMFLNQEKFPEAITDFDQVVAMTPADPWGYANRAVARAWTKEFSGAEADIAKAETLQADLPMLPRTKALLAEMREDYRGAAEAYSKSLTLIPLDQFALLHRSAMYRKLEKYDEALADLDALLRIGIKTPDVRLARANVFVKLDNFAAAATEANLLMKENPTEDYAFVVAGRILSRVKKKEEAFKAFDAALAIKPEAYVYINRAQSRPFLDHKGRLADLDLALKIDARSSDALAERAEELATMGDFQGALSNYDKAIEAEPERDEFVTYRAIILHKLGRTAEAEKVLAERRRNAKTASDHNALCWRQATAGIFLETALKDCEEALKLRQDYSAALSNLGLVLLRLGRFDEALTAYDKSVKRDVWSEALFGRALVHSAKGNKASAIADRKAALKEDPDVETQFAEYGLKL